MLANTQAEKRNIAENGVSVHRVDGQNGCQELSEMQNLGGTSQKTFTQTELQWASYTETYDCRPHDMVHLL